MIDAINLAACSGQHLLRFDLKLIGLWYQQKYTIRQVWTVYMARQMIINDNAVFGLMSSRYFSKIYYHLYVQNVHMVCLSLLSF